jgi:heme/copper-type cytochrome/quinol oxidase subunit 2
MEDKPKSKFSPFVIVGVIVAVLLIGTGSYMLIKNRKSTSDLSDCKPDRQYQNPLKWMDKPVPSMVTVGVGKMQVDIYPCSLEQKKGINLRFVLPPCYANDGASWVMRPDDYKVSQGLLSDADKASWVWRSSSDENGAYITLCLSTGVNPDGTKDTSGWGGANADGTLILLKQIHMDITLS